MNRVLYFTLGLVNNSSKYHYRLCRPVPGVILMLLCYSHIFCFILGVVCVLRACVDGDVTCGYYFMVRCMWVQCITCGCCIYVCVCVCRSICMCSCMSVCVVKLAQVGSVRTLPATS